MSREETTRLRYREPGAYYHSATPSQSLGDMLPNEREHGTETQTDKKGYQRPKLRHKKKQKRLDRQTDRPIELLKEGMTKLWPEKKGEGALVGKRAKKMTAKRI